MLPADPRPADPPQADPLQADPLQARALLAKESGLLVDRLRRFTPSRWSAAAPVLGTRADVVRHLAQWCADTAASCEGEPVRRLPVLQPDLLLADQLAVTVDDLLRSGPDPVVCAEALAHLLLHRWHLLDDVPPTSLGGPSVLELGTTVCQRAPRSRDPRLPGVIQAAALPPEG